jgi:3',5'-cyclic AMP phosphodiesterase CpdA
MSRTLQFLKDGTFTIVQFTDLHWQNGEPADLRTRALMEQVLQEEKPDLIVFTGDIIFSLKAVAPRKAFREAVAVAEQSGIPWAAVLGNHDSERLVSRVELLDIMLEHDGCVAQPGQPGVDGIGNYVVRVVDDRGRPQAALYFLDTGALSRIPRVPGYDWIRRSQIDWYVRQSRQMEAENGGAGLPSLAFFHIPVPEYEKVWRTQICYGNRNERAGSPVVNSGFFAAMAERGDILGTFCGHDHTNDYEGKLFGIRLCYGRASGYQAYGRPFYSRGARVIRLRAGEKEFDSWIRLGNGRKVENTRVHHPWAFWLKDKLRQLF